MPSHSSLPHRNPGPIRIAKISYPGFPITFPTPLTPLQLVLAAIVLMFVLVGSNWLVIWTSTLIMQPSPFRLVPMFLWWLVLGYLYRLLMQKTEHLRSQDPDLIGE